MVILNINIEHMNGSIERGAAGKQIIDHGIPTPLLARDDHVDDTRFRAGVAFVALVLGRLRVERGFLAPAEDAGVEGGEGIGAFAHAGYAYAPVLPALWAPFDGFVAFEHGEDAVGAVEAGVFFEELGVHVLVGGGVEGVDVRLGDAGAREADEGAGAEGDGGVGVVGGGEAQVGFHAAVVVAGADGAEFELEA